MRRSQLKEGQRQRRGVTESTVTKETGDGGTQNTDRETGLRRRSTSSYSAGRERGKGAGMRASLQVGSAGTCHLMASVISVKQAE